ncbi:MAG: 50S ribosomal protein L18, partial [Petrimonas sp.]|nr:50S ribosomal protein L18 [Petrimonas sp.]
MLTKTERRLKIKTRVRGKISGTKECPRLSVFRSNKQIYAQVIDDVNGV